MPEPAGPRDRSFVAWPQLVCAALGFGLSVYAFHIHQLVLAGENTGCGITATLSCDAVIGSRFGVVLGIPLGLYGVVFFLVMALMSFSSQGDSLPAAKQRLVLATLAVLGSLALEYIMWAILHKGCPVCMSIHALCFINFFFAWATYRGWGRRVPEDAGVEVDAHTRLP